MKNRILGWIGLSLFLATAASADDICRFYSERGSFLGQIYRGTDGKLRGQNGREASKSNGASWLIETSNAGAELDAYNSFVFAHNYVQYPGTRNRGAETRLGAIRFHPVEVLGSKLRFQNDFFLPEGALTKPKPEIHWITLDTGCASRSLFSGLEVPLIHKILIDQAVVLGACEDEAFNFKGIEMRGYNPRSVSYVHKNCGKAR
jgi:hypothetical protein